MGTRRGDGRHHVEPRDEFLASRSAFHPELEVFARFSHANSYPVHLHDRWQLTWILSGTVDLLHRGGSHVLNTGDGVLAAPFEPVAGHSRRGSPFGFVTLQVPVEVLPNRPREGVVARRNGASLCHSLMVRLMLARSGDEQRDALEKALAEFLLPSSEIALLAPGRARPHPAIESACSMLDADEKTIPLPELGSALRLNYRYVIGLFKRVMGVSPHQYVMARRLERVRRLLNDGEEIHTAAATAGFNDQSHLTRDFKRSFGVTPGAYQARHCHMNFLQNFPAPFL